jgi:hypothetical protein
LANPLRCECDETILISEAGITTAVKKLFAERFKLRMFDSRTQHDSFFGGLIGVAQFACT